MKLTIKKLNLTKVSQYYNSSAGNDKVITRTVHIDEEQGVAIIGKGTKSARYFSYYAKDQTLINAKCKYDIV